MEKNENTGLGLIKATIERVQNQKSLFEEALKKLLNSSEEELGLFLNYKTIHGLRSDGLKLLTCHQKIKIDAVDGTKTIFGAKEIFAHIDHEFGLAEMEVSELQPTSEGIVDIYGLPNRGGYLKLFQNISTNDLYKLTFSQHQIVNFCSNHSNLIEGEIFSFLLKQKDRLYLVQVMRDDLGLDIFRFPFEGGSVKVWRANKGKHVLVIPRIDR